MKVTATKLPVPPQTLSYDQLKRGVMYECVSEVYEKGVVIMTLDSSDKNQDTLVIVGMDSVCADMTVWRGQRPREWLYIPFIGKITLEQ